MEFLSSLPNLPSMNIQIRRETILSQKRYKILIVISVVTPQK